jgi:hypothetical protein
MPCNHPPLQKVTVVKHPRLKNNRKKMTLTEQRILAATLALALTVATRRAAGQTSPSTIGQESDQIQGSLVSSVLLGSENLLLENQAPPPPIVLPEISYPSPLWVGLVDDHIKFKLETLMDVLRDSRHESWVLSAYPDPQTARPLIGAGFSLDVSAMEHQQPDPFNPHTFIEPSSAQLWQAAGFSPARLQMILAQFDRQLKAWKKKNFRRKIRAHQLPQELTDEEATRLLYISVILAVHNARAYCRQFDRLTAAQQMALSQLVFQMGVNLEEFTQFLGAINDASYFDAAQFGSDPEQEVEHWKIVQNALIQSDWARRYTSRAVGVIAMFDPDYDEDPVRAENQVSAVLHPPPVRHHKKSFAPPVRAGNDSSHLHEQTGLQAQRGQ